MVIKMLSILVFSCLLFFVNCLDNSRNTTLPTHESGPIMCKIECSTPKTITRCKSNEEYSNVGFCDKTCDNPDNQNCYFLSPPGCKCNDGFYRMKGGDCVPAQSCQVPLTPTTQPSKSANIPCGLNERFTFQHTPLCEPSCHNPNLGLCPAIAGLPGCTCKDGYIRNGQGACVAPWQCSYYPSHLLYPLMLPPLFLPLENTYRGRNAGNLGNVGSLNLNVGASF